MQPPDGQANRPDRPINIATYLSDAALNVTKVCYADLIADATLDPACRQLLQSLASRSLPKDEFYHYCSLPAQWDALMGSEGWICVRNGEVVEDVLWRMN